MISAVFGHFGLAWMLGADRIQHMWNRLQANRKAVLLLAIFVFQLGATQCSCLEHNGWMQMISDVVLVLDGGQHGHFHGPRQSTEAKVRHHHHPHDHHDCLPYDATYRPTTSGVEITQSNCSCLVAFSTRTATDPLLTENCHRRQFHRRQCDDAMPSLRSMTQIFLL